MKQSYEKVHTTKPTWIKEDYPNEATFTELTSNAEADVIAISYHNGDYVFHFDLVYRSIWEDGAYSISRDII